MNIVDQYRFKVLLAGSGGCGKTTFLNRFMSGGFTEDTKITIGCNFQIAETMLNENTKVSLSVWDFGGEERFRVMLPSYSYGGNGCLLFFDLIRGYTFNELQEWVEIIRSTTDNIPIILIASKYDLLESPATLEIQMEKINEFMEKNNIKIFLPTSSKTGFNVKKSVHCLIESIFERFGFTY